MDLVLEGVQNNEQGQLDIAIKAPAALTSSNRLKINDNIVDSSVVDWSQATTIVTSGVISNNDNGFMTDSSLDEAANLGTGVLVHTMMCNRLLKFSDYDLITSVTCAFMVAVGLLYVVCGKCENVVQSQFNCVYH